LDTFPQREALSPDNGTARHRPIGGGLQSTPALSAQALATAIRDAALALGFARVGFCPIEPFAQAGEALRSWLERGLHGDMDYLAGEPRHDPSRLLPQARSLIVVALPYGGEPAGNQRRLPLTGQIARYARGADYHSVLKEKLRQLADQCAELTGRSVLARPCVDSAPLLEREAARRAGIGFTAKSTLTIAPGLGSYVLLGELLLDLELAPDQPLPARGCGSCTSCLTACPTSAFLDAYTLDARRCISYLTIEIKGPIPRDLRPLIGDWVFGCDVCQEVCPFNHSRRPRPHDPELAPRPHLSAPALVSLLELSAAGYRRFVKRTALRRVGRIQLQRNAAVALGNSGAAAALEPLGRSLATNPSELVRAHVAWALGRLPGSEPRRLLQSQREREREASVLEEIDFALSQSVRAPATSLEI
jgi:epoxyqueuosine reductase